MQLSPHQVRAVLDIKEQTLRYWKQAYVQLAARRGYGPCYSFGEVLVLFITKRLVEQLGMDVHKLQPAADSLFELCGAAVSLFSERQSFIAIDLNTMSVRSTNGQALNPSPIWVTFALHDLAQELRGRILTCIADDGAEQLPLALGPTSMNQKKERQGKRYGTS